MTSAVLLGIVLFDPSEENLQNCARNVEQFGLPAIVMDNSTKLDGVADRRALFEGLGAQYISDGRNLGTAFRMNALVGQALLNGIEWVMYLDQDSCLPDGYRSNLDQALLAAAGPCAPAVLCPHVADRSGTDPSPALIADDAVVPFAISSGMLIKVLDCVSVGGFDESLFLDGVDHEYCLRLRSSGFRILRVGGLVIHHELGRGGREVPFGLVVSAHPEWRRRLMWRNSIVMYRRYWRSQILDSFKMVAGRFVESLLCALYFRSWMYLTSAVRGVADGVRADRTRIHEGLG